MSAKRTEKFKLEVQIAPENIMYLKITTVIIMCEKSTITESWCEGYIETKTSPSKWGFPQQLQDQLIHKKCPKWTKVYLIWLKGPFFPPSLSSKKLSNEIY